MSPTTATLRHGLTSSAFRTPGVISVLEPGVEPLRLGGIVSVDTRLHEANQGADEVLDHGVEQNGRFPAPGRSAPGAHCPSGPLGLISLPRDQRIWMLPPSSC